MNNSQLIQQQRTQTAIETAEALWSNGRCIYIVQPDGIYDVVYTDDAGWNEAVKELSAWTASDEVDPNWGRRYTRAAQPVKSAAKPANVEIAASGNVVFKRRYGGVLHKYAGHITAYKETRYGRRYHVAAGAEDMRDGVTLMRATWIDEAEVDVVYVEEVEGV